MKNVKLVLPVIVISQFCCTSLWFAGNSVLSDLVTDFDLNQNTIGDLTSAVQFGFILGTLLFAVFTISDRFSPSKVFLISGIAGSLFNLGIIWEGNTLSSILLLRFFTGFFLAGIYPVGMKIATDYYEKGLGKTLGFLVGALVLGTAFPHLLKELIGDLPWEFVIGGTSLLALFGGFLMVTLVPDGPFRKPAQTTNSGAFFKVFQNQKFRSVAFGYFGHMWELYAFWTFVPIILSSYKSIHTQAIFNVPLMSFVIIAVGGLACVAAGYLAQVFGAQKTATISLLLSGICCFIFPFVFMYGNDYWFLGFLIIWGLVVIADSPLFSTLLAQNVQAEQKGTALTIVNSIGFLVTIVSIQLINFLLDFTDSQTTYLILALGPILGLIALFKGEKRSLNKTDVVL